VSSSTGLPTEFGPQKNVAWSIDAAAGTSSPVIVKGKLYLTSFGATDRVLQCLDAQSGQELWRQHAVDTGTMISEMEPSYVGLLTLMTEPSTPLYQDIREGRFQLLSGEEVLAETLLLLENINVSKTCVFRSNHASNYLSLKGDLPRDKDKMIGQLRAAMQNTGMLKDERFRML
jgi:hypothetical protein